MQRTGILSDTTQEAKDVLYDSLQKMSIQDRIELFNKINRDVESIATAGIKRTYPHYSRREINYELTRRRYGAELADLAFHSNMEN